MNAKSLFLCCAALALLSCEAQTPKSSKTSAAVQTPDFEVKKSPEEWKKALGSDRYRILFEKGTEAPHSGKYDLHFEKGVYSCGACGLELFKSDSKFDAHCGWPSFDGPIEEGRILETTDRSHGMTRTEIQCARCGGHLGHVFNDGPTSTGLRYCVNSLSLDFGDSDGKTKPETKP